MDVQFHCMIEKASVEQEKIVFPIQASFRLLVPISQGTEDTIVTEYVYRCRLEIVWDSAFRIGVGSSFHQPGR